MGTLDSLIPLLLALAPVIGYMLGRCTKEELAPGMPWFIATKRVLFTAVIAVFLYAHKWSLWPMVIGITALFAYFAFKPFRIWWLVQTELALAFVLSTSTPQSFLATALIFLYSLPTGSILARKKKLKGTLLSGAVFLIVVVIAQYFL